MQFEFRIKGGDSVTINCQLSAAGAHSPEDGPELIAASIADTELSQLTEADLFNLAAQIVDYFSRDQQAPKKAGDWYDEWLAATRT